jgi:hypothetical protein
MIRLKLSDISLLLSSRKKNNGSHIQETSHRLTEPDQESVRGTRRASLMGELLKDKIKIISYYAIEKKIVLHIAS